MSTLTAILVFVFVFAGALGGILLRRILPERHLQDDSREIIKLALGLVGTMVALILSLLIGSSKAFYDAQSAELTQISAQVVVLDRLLAHFGPEAKNARSMLRSAVEGLLDRSRSSEPIGVSQIDPAASGSEPLYEAIQDLTPQNESQRMTQTQAITIMTGVGQTRMLMYEQTRIQLPRVFLVILVFWLSMIFAGFGLLTSANGTSIASLLVAALSVAFAVFLILEMSNPYRGFIQVPIAPLESALVQLGR
jgi:hypothetical protein